MKTRAYTILSCLLVGAVAHAGFRHPVEETGAEANQIQATPHPTEVITSYKRVMPDRAVAMPEGYAPPREAAVPAATAAHPASVPAAAPAAPAAAAKAATPASKFLNAVKSAVKSAIPAYKPAPVATKQAPAEAKSAKKAPAEAKVAPKKAERQSSALRGPVPKAPALPAAPNIGNIPDVSLPHAADKDGLLTMQPPEKLDLKGLNRPQIHAFLKHARDMKEPAHEYGTEVRSRGIAEHYKVALHPEPGKSYRTAYKLALSKVGKIQEPPSAMQYENMVKRIDSLFMGLDLRYAQAVMELWQLAESPTNARDLQARDALFAGLLSTRAGWETTAAMMYEEAAAKRVDHENRYLKILWDEIEKVPNNVHVDKIVAAVSPLRVRDGSPAGDRANFALAKRLLTTRHHAPMRVFPSYETFQQRIGSRDLRDRLSILALVGQLRSKQDSRRLAAVGALRMIENAGSDENRQQARLALARTLLQHGESAEALELYRNVKKDGKNRLAVLGEQTYAEYLNGEYQDALGKTVALETPYFRYGYSPDIHLVEIMTRKAMCDFGGAEAGVQRFRDSYGPELAALDEVLKRNVVPAIFYEELMRAAESDQPHRYQRFLLQLSAVMENQKTLNQALAELARLDNYGAHQKSLQRPEGWENFTKAMRERWGDRAGDLRRISAETALTEVAYLAQRLRHTFAQVELLDLDVSTAASKNYNLQSAMNFPANHQEPKQISAEKTVEWPFQNEIWEDEIDYMRSKNPSKCANTKTASI